MANYPITLACLNIDRTRAIHRGQVKPNGIDLRVVEFTDVRSGFNRMFQGEFDVSEFSLTEHLFYTSRDRSDFIAIPVFPARWFRHSFIFCNTASDIRGPESLNGKRIGFSGWVQTAGIWVRGILEEEYGISPKETSWYASSVHHWSSGDGKEEIKPRNGSVINWMESRGNVRETIDNALVDGKLDAIAVPFIPPSLLRGDKRVTRLFEDYQKVELAYYKKSRILPIMHVLVARKSVVKDHPELPRELFELFTRSKAIGRQQTRRDQSISLVWKDHYLNQEQEIFQGDPWPFGLEKNRHVMEKLFSYCYEQGISDRQLDPKDLFDPSTWDLTEEAVPND